MVMNWSLYPRAMRMTPCQPERSRTVSPGLTGASGFAGLARAIPELDQPGLEDFLDGPPRTCAAAVALRAAVDRVAIEGGCLCGRHSKENTQHMSCSHCVAFPPSRR